MTDHLNMLTWNIRHGLGNDGNVDLPRIVSIIQDLDPDIIALQEVDVDWERSGRTDQPREIAHALQMESCFGPNLTQLTSEAHQHYGTMILSRYPIQNWTNTPLPQRAEWEPRGLLEAHILVPGVGNVVIFNTHLHVGDTLDGVMQRRSQAKCIANRVQSMDEPIVLAGDFNAQPGTDDLAPIEAVLADAWRAAGSSGEEFTIPTRPHGPGDARIDAIFMSRSFRVADCYPIVTVKTRLASDHYPVLARLCVPG
jgi:endonuclease/exonuclease/phosphatase family metal-dependent hydrolase